jgi:hypothetical protein
MPFPRKFKELLESSATETPEHVYMVYAVCGTVPESCGWSGWALEEALRATGTPYFRGPGGRIIESDDYLHCPKCGHPLFRTADAVRFDRSAQQPVPNPNWVEGIHYEVAEMEYVDDDDPAWEVEAEHLRQVEKRRREFDERLRELREAENNKPR